MRLRDQKEAYLHAAHKSLEMFLKTHHFMSAACCMIWACPATESIRPTCLIDLERHKENLMATAAH